jgi:CTP:molybdopterin cytidylyltransferase MocA
MIAAVVLAAGGSTRMGEPKALLQTPDGRRYVEAIGDCARAGGCRQVVVVLGPPHGDAIRAALSTIASSTIPRPAIARPAIARPAIAWNATPERGMLSSVQAGLAALPPDVDAALVWPVDIPFVDIATVRALVVHSGTIVVPTHNGRGGHPLRLARAHFAEVMTLDPARGLKALVDAHAAEVTRLPVADGAVLVDVDTPDDYARTRD